MYVFFIYVCVCVYVHVLLIHLGMCVKSNWYIYQCAPHSLSILTCLLIWTKGLSTTEPRFQNILSFSVIDACINAVKCFMFRNQGWCWGELFFEVKNFIRSAINTAACWVSEERSGPGGQYYPFLGFSQGGEWEGDWEIPFCCSWLFLG